MTRLEGSLEQLIVIQQSLLNPNTVLLYELDNQDRVVQCWVRTGVEFLWVFDLRPTEAILVDEFPYAHRVGKIVKS